MQSPLVALNEMTKLSDKQQQENPSNVICSCEIN